MIEDKREQILREIENIETEIKLKESTTTTTTTTTTVVGESTSTPSTTTTTTMEKMEEGSFIFF